MLNIAFVSKKNKPGVAEAINWLENFECNIDLFYAEINKPIDKKLFIKHYDIIISYINPWILPRKILSKTRIHNINFHPGTPEYPGIGCFNFAIYNNEKKYGVTAHIMTSKVDTGKIIMVDSFPITKVETVDSLSKKTYKKLLSIFKKTMKLFFKKKNIFTENIKWKRKPYKREQLNTLANLNINMNKNEFSRRLRAIYYSDYLRPTIVIHGHKFRYEKSKK